MNTFRRIISLTLVAIATLLAVVFVAIAPATASSAPELKEARLTLSHATIYPHIDGYRDSLGITLAKKISNGTGDIPLGGALTITRAGKTLANYPITTSATETYAWSGWVNAKIVPGTYTVTARIVGPNVTLTKHALVVVSRKQLLARTRVVTITAQKFFQHGYTAQSSGSGCAPVSSGSLACTSMPAAPAVGSNYVKVPAAVLLYAGYRPYTAKLTVTLSHVSTVAGTDTFWEWDVHNFAFTGAGTHTTTTSSFGSARTTQVVKFRVGGGSAAQFDSVAITYVYSVLGLA